MKKILGFALLALSLAALFPRAASAQQSGPPVHYAAGVYDSRAYYTWRATVFNGPYASGSVSITVAPAFVTLADGYTFSPFSTNVPLTVGVGTPNAETVTPSAVTIAPCPPGLPNNFQGGCATVTATFSNSHGQGDIIISGSQGVQDAIQDAGNSGGSSVVYWFIDPGIVTLSTGGANTTLGSISIPARSTVLSATARVTTTIATCAGGWSLGFSTGTEFGAANTTLTAGTTTDSSTIATPVTMNAAATVPIAHCTTSNASAGAIHARFSGYKLVAPLS